MEIRYFIVSGWKNENPGPADFGHYDLTHNAMRCSETEAIQIFIIARLRNTRPGPIKLFRLAISDGCCIEATEVTW